MTVAVQTNSNTYNGNGLTQDFAFTFYCTDANWVVVKVNNVVVAPSSVTPNVDQSATPGGSIHFTVAPPTGVGNVFIQRHVPLTQSFNYTYLDAFPATSHMGALDKLTAEIQDLAILVATELTLPPFTIANALQYLQVNALGTLLQWADPNPIPKPYQPGLFLSASDPTTLIWAAGGGGGGGAGIVGPVVGPQTDALLIDGVGGNVLHAAVADETHPGISSITAQKFAGQKMFIDGAVVEVWDIRQFGAVANDNTVDLSIAYYAAVNHILTAGHFNPFFDYQTFGGRSGAIYIPEGSYYTSRPLMLVGNILVYGDGNHRTYINAGLGTVLTPTTVQGFGGPVFYSCGMVTPTGLASYTTAVVAFNPPLNGTSTRSLHMKPTMCNIPLHDSYPWTWFLGMMIDTQKLCLRFEYKIPTAPSLPGEFALIGSQGPIDVWPDGHVDRALCVRLISDGSHYKVRAYLTTCPAWVVGTFNMTTGTEVVLNSGNLPINSTFNVEVDYDGSAFWLYINGVHQDHASATGPVFRQPWEGVMIGSAGLETDQSEAGSAPPLDSSLGCIELARINRHTGTGSFTAAPGPYTADSNTMWLCNWDQPDFPFEPTNTNHLPFLMAETAITMIANNGPDSQPMSSPNLVPHYMRMLGGSGVSYAGLKDLHIYSQTNTSGFVAFASAFFRGENLASSFACRASFKLTDGNSFYSSIYKSYSFSPCDYGFFWYGNVYEPYSMGPIGVQVVFGGEVTLHDCQPNFTCFCPTILGPGNSRQSLFQLSQASNDSEGWSYLRQAAALGLYNVSGTLITYGNILAVNNSNGPPVIIFGRMSGTTTMIGDSFQPGAPGNSGFGGTAFQGSKVQFVSNPLGSVPEHSSIVIKNPTGTWGPYAVSPVVQALPYSDTPGTVTLEFPEGQSNQKSLSISEVVGRNLTGEFTIMSGFTWGHAQFTELEPDANYDVIVTYKGAEGGVPAAGSTVPGAIGNIAVDGFFMETGVDPGGSVRLTFTYLIVRNKGIPFFFEYLPTPVPGDIANPLVPKYTNFTPWAMGVTVIPVGPSKSFHQDGTQVAETILSVGLTPGDTHWFDITFNPASADITVNFAGVAGGVSGRVESSPTTFLAAPGPRSKFLSMWHPGVHNIVITAVTATYGALYVDGRAYNFSVPVVPPFWTGFLPRIYRGSLPSGAQPLTRATLRDFKVDIDLSQCITLEQDAGPGLMNQNAFIGDEWTQGVGSTSTAGGWATQIADSKYGTHYYWSLTSQRYTILPANGTNGMLVDFWDAWGQYQPFETVVFLAGWHDLLSDAGTPPTAGATAIDTWAGMLSMLEGAKAHQQFTLPTSNTQAIALFATNSLGWGGGVTATIAGVTFPVPWLGTEAASFTSLASAMNLDVTVGSLVTAVYTVGPPGGNGYVTCTAVAPGAAGNGIPVSAGGGAFWYTGFPTANATFAGKDCVLDINNVTFISNFITDAATSCNIVVNAINTSADPLIAGVVTAANVGNKVVITATTAGIAGNEITTASNRLNGAYLGTSPTDFTSGFLVGGLNGVLGRVGSIVLCTLPPFGATNPYYTAGKETERQTFNTSLRNWVIANAGAGAILADMDVTVGAGTSLNPVYDNGQGYLNDLGHTAMFALVNPLVP